MTISSHISKIVKPDIIQYVPISVRVLFMGFFLCPKKESGTLLLTLFIWKNVKPNNQGQTTNM